MAASNTGLTLATLGRWASRWAMIVVLATGAVTSHAQTAVSWSATVNGSWGTTSNWTGNALPANSLTTNYASFNNATGVTVTMGTAQSVAGLDFGSSAGAYTLTNPSGGGKTLTLGAYGINVNSTTNQTISGASLTLKLGAASTFTVGSTGSLTLASTLAALNTNGFDLTLRGTGSGGGTIASVISGNGGIIKLDSGTWTISGANTYAGATTIGSSNGASGGTLTMGASNVLSSGTLTIYGGTLATGSSSFTDTVGALTLGGGQSGTAASITGNGTITLGGTLTYDATNNANGATIAANIGLGANRTITVGDSTAAATDLAISGVVSGAFNITKSGAGTLSLSGANTYTGTTTISQGTIQVDANAPSGSAGALGNASTAVTINDASTGANNTALLIGTSGVSVGRAITVANLGTGTTSLGGNISSGTGTFTGNVTMNKATTFNADGTSNITFSTGVVSGTGNLTKTGTGTITLSGANTYTGKTSVQDGTLSVASLNNVTGGTASSNLGAPTTVANGTIDLGNLTTTGTLKYTGTGQTTDRVINLAGSTGGGAIDSSGSGTLTFTGNLTAAAGSKTLTLTGSNTTAAVFSGNIVNSSGTVAVAKSGSGTWTLSGTNTYSGGTTLNTGTLNINSTTALGTGTFTIAGGTIDNTTGSAITLSNNNAQAWNGDFTFTGTKDLNLGTGAVTLGATRTVTTTAGNLTIGGAISGASFGLTKAGAGSLLLTNANSSYTGATTINVGTLSASTLANGGANSSIGASSNAAANVVLNGGTLQYTGNSVTTDRLFSVGTSGGTLDVSTSGQTLTLSNTGALGFNSQTGARTLTLTGAGNGSLASAIGDNSGATALTKSGAGTWTLTGTNTQTGTTTVSAGTLTVNSGASLSGSTAALVVNGGTLNLNNTAQTVASLTGSGGTVSLGSGNTLTVNTTGTDTFSGALGGSGTLTKSGSGTNSLTIGGDSSAFTGTVNVSQGTLIAAGNLGTTSLTGTNTVSSGAALGLSGGFTVGNNNATFSIVGDGVSSSGAIYNSAGSNSLNGSVTLAGDARIGAAGGALTIGSTRPSFTPSGHTQPTENGFITLGNATSGSNLTFSGAGNITVNDRIRDYSGQVAGSQWSGTTQTSGPVAPSGSAGNVTIDMASGAATVTYAANANSYTGTTFVKNGTLVLNTTSNSVAPHSNTTDSFHSINGPLVIGNGSTSATVRINSLFGPNETMAIGTAVTLYNDGTLDLNRASQTIGSLTFTNGGTVLTGTGGHLYLNGDVAFNATANGQTAQIGNSANDGYLSLELNLAAGVDTGGGASRTFTINPVDGSSTANLNVYSTVVSGSVIKEGTGTLTFYGNNTYTGTTNVNTGIFNARAGTSGGYSAFGSGDGSDSSGTNVASGATVQLQGGITVTNEKLNLNGNGFNSAGALQNVSGNNTWGTTTGFGSINLVTDSRINSDSGTLTIPTIMTSTGNNKTLTVGGAGDTTISGSINTGGTSAGLIKDGAGTLTLSGNNGFQGATTINAGVVVAANNGALGTTDTGTTVSAGALHLSGGITIGSEALTLNGTGISGNGALRNVSGNNTFGGTITAATSTRIQNDVAGNSLALTGGLVTSGSSGIDLNFGGTGNTTVSGNNGGGYTVNNGSSTLTKDGTGTLAFSLTGAQNQVGSTHINAGTMKVSSAVGSAVLSTGAIDSVAGTTLAIASGAQVTANYSSGTTIFSGVISDVGGDGGGTFKKTGAGTLVFGSSFNAGTSSTLILDGGTLKLGNTSGVSITFDTIHITANTTIDFNASYATTLSSSKLIIDAGVQISVINWVSLSDVWYATSTINGNTGSIMDLLNQSPLNQITFNGPSTTASNTATTWVTTQGGQYFNHEIRPTPEPSTYGALLLGASLALLGWRRYRRTPRAQADAPLARGAAALKS